jgi:hypothetical protein
MCDLPKRLNGCLGGRVLRTSHGLELSQIIRYYSVNCIPAECSIQSMKDLENIVTGCIKTILLDKKLTTVFSKENNQEEVSTCLDELVIG